MALRVWLPLNGDTKNIGMTNKAMSGSPNSWGTDGKIGKCATFAANASNVIYNNATDLNYTDNFSWCMWLKKTFVSGTAQFAFTNGRADYGGYGYGLQITSSTACAARFGNKSYTVSVSDGVWTHLAFTKDGNKISVFKDGSLVVTATFDGTLPTYSDGNGLGLGCFHYTGNIYPFTGSINDFRIYDHCLSAKEVKELSKGLILHYKLDGNGVGQPNLLKNSRDGLVGLNANVTDTDGSIVGSTTGNETWREKYYPLSSAPQTLNGKVITISLFFKTNDPSQISRMYFGFGGFSSSGSRVYDTNINVSSYKNSNKIVANQWQYIYYSYTVPSTWTNEYATYRIQIKAQNTMTSAATMYWKNIKIEEGSVPTPWCPNTEDTIYNKLGFNSTIEKDCSGFGYDGTDSGTISVGSDSSRHCASTNFASGFIKTATLPTNMYQMSVSFWVKLNATNNYMALFIPNGNPTHSNGVWLSVNCESCKVWAYQGGNAPNYTKGASGALDINKWYHCVYVFDNGKARWYINGETCGNEVTYTGRSYIAGNIQYTLGDSYTGTNWSGTPFNGNLSDFRIYATALSADDIKQLYKVSASIDNNNNIFADDFIEEDKFHVNSRSIVKSGELVEDSTLTKVKVFANSLKVNSINEV